MFLLEMIEKIFEKDMPGEDGTVLLIRRSYDAFVGRFDMSQSHAVSGPRRRLSRGQIAQGHGIAPRAVHRHSARRVRWRRRVISP